MFVMVDYVKEMTVKKSCVASMDHLTICLMCCSVSAAECFEWQILEITCKLFMPAIHICNKGLFHVMPLLVALTVAESHKANMFSHT